MANVSQLCAIHHFHLSRNSNGLEKKFDSRNPFLRRSSNRLRIECNLIEREKEKLKNERGGRSKKERERYEGRIPRREMVSGACLVYRGVVESKPLAKVIEISPYPCTSIRRFCAAHLRSRLSGLSRRCPSRATACGCGLTAPIGMARIGYWRSSNGIEQGSGGKAGRGDKRERFL